MPDKTFYGAGVAAVHHDGFGSIATEAAAVVTERLRRAGLDQGLVVDLGSGSGILSRHLTDAGHPVLGIELSPDMVAIAERHAPGATFLCSSVYDADLPANVAAVAAVGEILNYRADDRAGWDALTSVLERVRTALRPGGAFLFDLSGPGRGGPTGETTSNVEGDGWFITARRVESADHAQLDRIITLFECNDDGTWDRSDEHHTLVLFDPQRVVDRCEQLGFTVESGPGYGQDNEGTALSDGWTTFVATLPRP